MDATKPSSIVTGGVTITAATLIPFVTWAIGGFDRAHVPEGVPYLIAAALITVGHGLYNIAASRFYKSVASQPAGPSAPSPSTQQGTAS
jgi:hypothetical protein